MDVIFLVIFLCWKLMWNMPSLLWPFCRIWQEYSGQNLYRTWHHYTTLTNCTWRQDVNMYSVLLCPAGGNGASPSPLLPEPSTFPQGVVQGPAEEVPSGEEEGGTGIAQHTQGPGGGGAGWLAEGPRVPQGLDQTVVRPEARHVAAVQECQSEGRYWCCCS